METPFNTTRINYEFKCEEKFTIINNETTFDLTIQMTDDCLIFNVKIQLPFSLYEGIYSFEEFNKLPYFKNYNNTPEIFDIIRQKINSNYAKLRLEDNKIIISVLYKLDEVEKIVNLSLTRIEEIDQPTKISALSDILVELEKRFKKLEAKQISTELELAKKDLEISLTKQLLKVKEDEINLIKNDIKNRENEIKEIKTELSSQINQISNRLNTTESSVSLLKQEIIAKNIEIDKLNLRIKTIENEFIKQNQTLLEVQTQNLWTNTDCLIKSGKEENQLKQWIDSSSNIKFTLLYDSLKDTDSASSFHQKCDNMGPTLSIIESEHGLRFGGYSKHSWDVSNKWKSDDLSAFIFSLSKMMKFPCKEQKYVIYGGSTFNLVYGGGSDISISDKFTSNTDSYSNLGDSYDSLDVKEPETYLAGSYKFMVKKVEVYKVEKLI